MNTRTKFTNIKKETKSKVWERDDGCCIICGKPVGVFNANAHIVPRSSGGLGIEQNIVTLCISCHHLLDNTTSRKNLMKLVKEHITKFYKDWNEEDMKYRKGINYE